MRLPYLIAPWTTEELLKVRRERDALLPAGATWTTSWIAKREWMLGTKTIEELRAATMNRKKSCWTHVAPDRRTCSVVHNAVDAPCVTRGLESIGYEPSSFYVVTNLVLEPSTRRPRG